MKRNRFFEKFKQKTDSELQEIIENKNSYKPEAVEFAKQLLNNREKNPKNLASDEKINSIQIKKNKQTPEKENYEFKYSFTYKIFICLGILLLIYLGCLGWEKGNSNSLFLFIIAIIGIIFNHKLINNEPEIVINKKGIWTSKLGEKNWSEIQTIVAENKGFIKYFSKYINDNLFIYLKGDLKTNPSDKIDLRGIANKKKLRELVSYYTNIKDNDEFQENTFVFGNNIYEKENQIEKFKNSFPRIVLLVFILSITFPLIDKYLGSGLILIEKYGYQNSTIISFTGFSCIFFGYYIYLNFKKKK